MIIGKKRVYAEVERDRNLGTDQDQVQIDTVVPENTQKELARIQKNQETKQLNKHKNKKTKLEVCQ